ncbi:unnamed protein product [Brassica oleracea var. botrytis]|uniref:Uncharacterized protein n=1 Tax=Brassica oleracea TaxID=3712 RepID=A0A3P6EY33_BRAOL|nr:unnamed protein product [Brassica oleracea]
MFVRVPFQQVLQMNFDNTYPIDLFGWFTTFGTLTQHVDDPYEEIFGVHLTKTNLSRWMKSGCELECEASGQLAR